MKKLPQRITDEEAGCTCHRFMCKTNMQEDGRREIYQIMSKGVVNYADHIGSTTDSIDRCRLVYQEMMEGSIRVIGDKVINFNKIK